MKQICLTGACKPDTSTVGECDSIDLAHRQNGFCRPLELTSLAEQATLKMHQNVARYWMAGSLRAMGNRLVSLQLLRYRACGVAAQ